MNATKNATTVKLSGGDLGPEIMYVRCDLTQASAPIQVDYHNDGVEEWCGSQFQCADTRHTIAGLIERVSVRVSRWGVRPVAGTISAIER